jgi:hypothetical protein
LGKKVIEYFYGGGADIEMSSERFLIFDLRELDRLSTDMVSSDILKCKISRF